MLRSLLFPAIGGVVGCFNAWAYCRWYEARQQWPKRGTPPGITPEELDLERIVEPLTDYWYSLTDLHPWDNDEFAELAHPVVVQLAERLEIGWGLKQPRSIYGRS